MNLQTIPRAAVNGYLKVLRMPADALAGALRPQDGRGAETTPVEVMLDRLEASVRDAAGRVLRDPALQETARRQRVAADERERALTLRARAERESRRADEELVARHQDAEQQRRDAARLAEQRKERARQDRARTSAQLTQAEERGRALTHAAKEHAEDEIDARARHERVEQLDVEAHALEEEEEALVARSEAQRLRRAAGEIKAKRKTGSR
jgi:hypothetical protein